MTSFEREKSWFSMDFKDKKGYDDQEVNLFEVFEPQN